MRRNGSRWCGVLFAVVLTLVAFSGFAADKGSSTIKIGLLPRPHRAHRSRRD